MKRENIILSFFLILGLVAIISIYIAKQGLKEALKKEKEEKEKLQTQSISRQGPGFTGSTRERVRLKEDKEQEARPEEKETDLSQIPDDYNPEKEITGAEIEAEGPIEASTSEASNLQKQPSASELKQLKAKGAIIY